jgi:predicted phosphodiesterase
MGTKKYGEYLEESRELNKKGFSSMEIAAKLIEKYHLNVKIQTLSRRIREQVNGSERKYIPKNIDDNNKKAWEESEECAAFSGVTRTPITTKEQAIKYSGADMKVWDVERWLCNTWGVTNGKGEYFTNFQVKLWFVKKKKKVEEYYNELHDYIKNNTKPVKFKPDTSTSRTPAIWAMSDMHLGLNNEGNGVDAFCSRLNIIAGVINKSARKENHILIGGDLLESGASGYMHTTQIYESIASLTGVSGIRSFYVLFKKHFLDLLEVPVTSILVVAGNHDRSSKDSKDASPFGSMAEVFYHFLCDNLEGVEVLYGFDVLQKTIDGVDYILTHGDNAAAKNVPIMIQDYGDPNADYHVLITAHYHSRKTEKTMKIKSVIYEKRITVQEENLNFRKIQLAPLCLANGYAKKLGKSSGCGFTQVERSEFTENINHFDYSVH